MITLFLVLLVLLFLSAFFSASETALTSMFRTKARFLNDKRLTSLLENPERLLTTILIGNNLVNVAASTIAASLAISRFGNYGLGIATGVVTFLILIFGELIPKTLAMRKSEMISKLVSTPIWVLSIVFYPVGRVLGAFAGIFVKGKALPNISKEEIHGILDVWEESGAVESEEKKMIHSIFELGYTSVKEVMTARMDIFAMNSDVEVGEALEQIAKTGYSRIPIYESDIDNIIGVIYAKDLLKHRTDVGRPAKEFIHPPYYIPESKRVDELLQEFQRNAIQIAVVIDEHGGTAGLITLEDILEEMVGEIFDEYDIREKMIKKLDSKTYVVNGKMVIDELSEILNTEVPEDEYETVGGFVFSLFGRIPKEGEKIKFKEFEFKVEKIVKRRIKAVRITQAR